jgi:hypothetical protein
MLVQSQCNAINMRSCFAILFDEQAFDLSNLKPETSSEQPET